MSNRNLHRQRIMTAKVCHFEGGKEDESELRANCKIKNVTARTVTFFRGIYVDQIMT